MWLGFEDEATKRWFSIDNKQFTKLSVAEFERVILNKWSQAKKHDKGKHVGLFPTGIFLLHVHGLIQNEKIIVSINPSCKKNLINVNLAKKLQVPTKHMEHTQVNNEQMQVYEDLKISMDKYVLHSDFYASNMANEDVVFR